MSDQTLQDIRDRLNIAEVIGDYIQVKKAGTNFKAICPFHNEKTPSLMISPQKQIWHCFGCGEGGDVFTFVMRYENLEFRDALKILAEKAGVQLPVYHPADKRVEDEKELLFRINGFAARLYHQILLADKRGANALAYLKHRGLRTETIEKWQIGYAPDDFHFLEQALLKKAVKVADLVKAGVAVRSEKGQTYDRFRGRITFPIFNYHGEIIGFSARIFPDDDKVAKYVNSPDTLIYNKSQILFGLNFAKDAIRRQDEAVIVEGQMDAISAHQAGFSNVVASSGTALTQDQLRLLGRLTKNLKFCFDSDQAGLLATKRAIELYLGQDFTIKIIDLGGAKDPDELIKDDPEKWARQVKTAPLYLDFYFQKAFQNFQADSAEQKKRIAKEILPLVARLVDPLEQDHYLRVLAEKLNTTQEVLKESIRNFAKPNLRQPKQKILSGSSSTQPANFVLQKEVLGGMLVFPDFAKLVFNEGEIEDFDNSEIRNLLQPAFASGSASAIGQDGLLAKEAIFMVESQLDQREGNETALKRELKKSFVILRLNAIKRRQKVLTEEIKKAESDQNKVKVQELKEEFARLSRVRAGFEQVV